MVLAWITEGELRRTLPATDIIRNAQELAEASLGNEKSPPPPVDTGTGRWLLYDGAAVPTVLHIEMNDLSSGVAKVLEFRKSPVRVGRNHLNEISIQDGFVSEYHGVFRFDDAGVVFTDLGSTNGTFFAGQKVTAKAPLPLENDARLVFGRLEFRVQRRIETGGDAGLSVLSGEIRPGGATMVSPPQAPMAPVFTPPVAPEGAPGLLSFTPPSAEAAVDFSPPGFAAAVAPPPPGLPNFSGLGMPLPSAALPDFRPPSDQEPAIFPSSPPGGPPAFPAPGFAMPMSTGGSVSSAAPSTQAHASPQHPPLSPSLVLPYPQPFAPHVAATGVSPPSMVMNAPATPSIQFPTPGPPSRPSLVGFPAAAQPPPEARGDEAVRTRRILETIGDALIELRRSFEEVGAEMGVRPLTGTTTLHHARDGREIAEYLSSGPDLESRLSQIQALFREMSDHQQNVLRGVQDSTRALIETLDPRANDLENGPKLFNVGKAKTQWRDYIDRFVDLLEGDTSLQDAVFGEAFSDSYGSSDAHGRSNKGKR